MTRTAKDDLQHYLTSGREALLWKLEGVSEYDVRRPLVPTGTNLLGLVKHVASVEAGYLGAVFGRPFPDPMPWIEDSAEDNADMWATAEQSREWVVDLYRRVGAHSEATLAALELDARGEVPWWPPERRSVTLHQIVVQVIAETHTRSRLPGSGGRLLIHSRRTSCLAPLSGETSPAGEDAGVRIGITLLPELPWAEDRERWRQVEAYGFDHAWTFDHLAWRSLADSPWYATIPTLTAASLSTTTLRLGTWVTTPNFRHPVPLAKELMTLDAISGGRLNVGIGAGAPGFDSEMLGQPELTRGERTRRFAEFVAVLDLVLSQPTTTWHGEFYTVEGARTVPACVQSPHPPFVVAANGPRGMRLALERGAGWVTTTGVPLDSDPAAWWQAAADRSRDFDEVADDISVPDGFTRYLNMEARTSDYSSAEQVVDAIGQAATLGYTDVVLAWPRPDGPMAGDPRLLERVAERLPELHTLGA